MRKLVVSTYTTLDGVIQPLDWSGQNHSLEAQEERGAYARELLFSADALLLGRETCEIFAEAWSSRTAADDGPGEPGCVDRINSLPKYVASTLLQGDIPAALSKLKDQPGQTIMMYGCGQLARTLLEHGLIDEVLFWVYPVVRGSGTRLFTDGANADLELLESRSFKAGFTVFSCRPKERN
jgi:dihydrofolate reductase